MYSIISASTHVKVNQLKSKYVNLAWPSLMIWNHTYLGFAQLMSKSLINLIS